MVRLLNLLDIQALAAATPYGGERVLASESAALLISAASLLYDYDLWQGAGYVLTEAEKDDIAAMIALAVDDLLAEGEEVVSDFVKLDEVVYTSDTPYAELLNLDFSAYRAAKIIVSGMLSDDTVTWAEHCKLQLNGTTTASLYNSEGRFWYSTTTAQLANVGDYGGLKLPYAIASDPPNSGVFGCAEIMLYNPYRSEVKHIRATGVVGGTVSGELGNWTSQGTFEDTGDIDEVKIIPDAGTTFLIDTSSGNEPNELRMTVYGLK